MFPITLHIQLLYHYDYHFSNFNGYSCYLPSDLQRSPTYYYGYMALMSSRGACSMALSFIFLRYFSMFHWIEYFLAQHTLQDLHRILI